MAELFPADVTSEVAVRELATEVERRLGPVDVLVVNATGPQPTILVEDLTWQDQLDQLLFFVKSPTLLVQAVLAGMKARGGGRIINIGSDLFERAAPGLSAYSAAKAASLHLARCLAEELGGDGIRVNTVNPDAILEGSKIWDSAWRGERARAYGIPEDKLEDHYRARTTLKVNIFPADVAEAVLYFASPTRAAKSTGNILNVDGGVALSYPR